MPSCCAPYCQNNGTTKPFRTFHRFPCDSTRGQIWLNCLNLNKRVTTNLRVCSDHFHQRDFYDHFIRDGIMVKKLMKSAKPVYAKAMGETQAAVKESEEKYTSIQMTPVVIDCQPTSSSLRKMPIVIQYRPTCSSLQIKPVVSESQPARSSLLMMRKLRDIEHNYATDVSSLKQKYEDSIICLDKKNDAIKKMRRRWTRSLIKISKLVKELKETKQRCDEAYSRLKAYEEIPGKLLKKPTKECRRAKKDVLIKLTFLLNKRSGVLQ